MKNQIQRTKGTTQRASQRKKVEPQSPQPADSFRKSTHRAAVHYDWNGFYLCSMVARRIAGKMTDDKRKVTCANCRVIMRKKVLG